MAITLGGAAPGRTVKLNYNGAPEDFFVGTHGAERTVLVQRYLTASTYENQDVNLGYIGGPADSYLNGPYLAGFDANVIAAMAGGEVEYEYYNSNGQTGTKIATRSAFIIRSSDYTSGAFPAAATTKGGSSNYQYWASNLYSGFESDRYSCINTSGKVTYGFPSDGYRIRPCISLPNNTIVEDDDTLVVVSQDSLKILPCIKY